MNKIKILNVAFTDMGGAGKASLIFNEMFNQEGYKSVLLVKESNENNKDVIILPSKKNNIFSKFFNKQKNRFKYLFSHYFLFNEKYFFFNLNESKTEIISEEISNAVPFVPDIIFLHWITGFINTKVISELQQITKAKIFWIMMDNAPLTGGCHYPWDCEGFFNSCSNCPAIKLAQMQYYAESNLEYKKSFMPLNLELITCSSTDYSRAKNSSVFRKNKIHNIIFPINKDKFTVGNMKDAKNNFLISNDKKIVFYGASNVKNTRKGLQYFLDSMKILQDKCIENKTSINDFAILVAGNIDVSFLSGIKFPLFYYPILNEVNLIRAYQASSVFVSTSIEDSGPLMVNQSIMTGTPVVSFNIGVAVDIVHNGLTGYLSELYDTKSMANNIYEILIMNDFDYLEISKNCREMAIEKFSFENTIKKYNKLIKSS